MLGLFFCCWGFFFWLDRDYEWFLGCWRCGWLRLCCWFVWVLLEFFCCWNRLVIWKLICGILLLIVVFFWGWLVLFGWWNRVVLGVLLFVWVGEYGFWVGRLCCWEILGWFCDWCVVLCYWWRFFCWILVIFVMCFLF